MTDFETGFSPLTLAAKQGHVDAVKYLALCQGVDVNSRDGRGCTPIETATSENSIAMIRTLAELGADLNTPNDDGVTPVSMVAEEGHEGTG